MRTKAFFFPPLTPVSLLQDGVPAFHSRSGKQGSIACLQYQQSLCQYGGNKLSTVIFCSSQHPPRTSSFPGVLKLGNPWDLGGSLWALTELHRGPVIEELDINVNSSMWALCFSEKTPWDNRSWTDPNFQANNHSAVLFPWLLWVSFFTHYSHLWSLVYSWCWVWQSELPVVPILDNRVRGLYLITPAVRSPFMAFAEQIQKYLRNIASFVTFLFSFPLLPSPPMFTSTCAQFHSRCASTISIQMVFHLSKAQIGLKISLFHFGSKSQLLILSSVCKNDAFALSWSRMKSLTSLFDVLLILPLSPSQNLESCHH